MSFPWKDCKYPAQCKGCKGEGKGCEGEGRLPQAKALRGEQQRTAAHDKHAPIEGLPVDGLYVPCAVKEA